MAICGWFASHVSAVPLGESLVGDVDVESFLGRLQRAKLLPLSGRGPLPPSTTPLQVHGSPS